MTIAWIQVAEQRSLSEPSGYSVKFTVERAYGVPPELFVMRTDDGSYSHVATVDEVADLLSDRDAARAVESPFFRTTSATLQALTREGLLAHTTHVKRRLAEVTLAWDSGAAALIVPGTSTYTLEGTS